LREFIAVNFSHLKHKRVVEPKDWYNMISTGGASLQLGIVYHPLMLRLLGNFFETLIRAVFVCNIENIPYDWVDVYKAGVEADGVTMKFESIFADIKDTIRGEYVEKITIKQQLLTMKVKYLGEPEDIQKQYPQIEESLLDRLAVIDDEIQGKSELKQKWFEDRLERDCQDGNCFVAISFLGVTSNTGVLGECTTQKKKLPKGITSSLV